MLGSLVLVIFLATLYDLFKRFKFYLKCREIISHSTVIINSESEPLNSSITMTPEPHEITIGQSYLVAISRNYMFFLKKNNFDYFRILPCYYFTLLENYKLKYLINSTKIKKLIVRT